MKIGTIAARELDAYIDKPGTILIDVRTAEEFEQKHLKNAISMPQAMLEESFPKLPYGIEYVLYCDRGILSFESAREFDKRGYDVKTVIGGMTAYPGKNVIYCP